jgi:hypothetical protein
MIHVLESTKWKDHQRCERRAIQLMCFFFICSFSLENLFEYVACIIRIYCLNGDPFVKIVSGKKGQKKKKKRVSVRRKKALFLVGWRRRVSIPVPLACKASALPFELHPQTGIPFKVTDSVQLKYIYSFIFLTNQLLEFAEIFYIWKFVSLNAG